MLLEIIDSYFLTFFTAHFFIISLIVYSYFTSFADLYFYIVIATTYSLYSQIGLFFFFFFNKMVIKAKFKCALYLWLCVWNCENANKSKENIFLNQKVDFTTNNREDVEDYFILQ